MVAEPEQLNRSGSAATSATTRSLASATRDKLSDVMSHIQKPETRSGLKGGWDSLVNVMFAPCAGTMNGGSPTSGGVGGVPREDIIDMVPTNTPPRWGSRGGEGNSNNNNKGDKTPPPAWGASVPFEVSASQIGGASLVSSGIAAPQSTTTPPRATWGNPSLVASHFPTQQARTPVEQRKSKSRAKLRQLGAQHQLASGFTGESLADTARPISPDNDDNGGEEKRDLIDFDDGISAISSHTLEEMERRRTAKERKNVVRLHPLDFSQIIDENTELKYIEPHSSGGLLGPVTEEVTEKDTEVAFGEPFYEEEGLFQSVRPIVTDEITSNLNAGAELTRVISSRTSQTNNTSMTEDSHEFEDMYNRHEAMYWTDQDQVASGEKNTTSRTTSRPSQRMSIEERARRLRELSRSRSRSDGTGSVS